MAAIACLLELDRQAHPADPILLDGHLQVNVEDKILWQNLVKRNPEYLFSQSVPEAQEQRAAFFSDFRPRQEVGGFFEVNVCANRCLATLEEQNFIITLTPCMLCWVIVCDF